MHSEFPDPVAEAALPDCCGLLSPTLRRDLTDLNAQYLELGVASLPVGDSRFDWNEPVRHRLAGLDGAVRQRMASVPFALFQLRIPPTTQGSAARVADVARDPCESGWTTRCTSFVHQAAFFARRLCDGAPLAANVVLDLPPDVQALLCGLRPSEIAGFASHSGFLRPRWPGHQRFWQMLEAAACADSAIAMQWAHCVGVCLLGSDDCSAGSAVPAAARRKPRR